MHLTMLGPSALCPAEALLGKISVPSLSRVNKITEGGKCYIKAFLRFQTLFTLFF